MSFPQPPASPAHWLLEDRYLHSAFPVGCCRPGCRPIPIRARRVRFSNPTSCLSPSHRRRQLRLRRLFLPPIGQYRASLRGEREREGRGEPLRRARARAPGSSRWHLPSPQSRSAAAAAAAAAPARGAVPPPPPLLLSPPPSSFSSGHGEHSRAVEGTRLPPLAGTREPAVGRDGDSGGVLPAAGCGTPSSAGPAAVSRGELGAAPAAPLPLPAPPGRAAAAPSPGGGEPAPLSSRAGAGRPRPLPPGEEPRRELRGGRGGGRERPGTAGLRSRRLLSVLALVGLATRD